MKKTFLSATTLLLCGGLFTARAGAGVDTAATAHFDSAAARFDTAAHFDTATRFDTATLSGTATRFGAPLTLDTASGYDTAARRDTAARHATIDTAVAKKDTSVMKSRTPMGAVADTTEKPAKDTTKKKKGGGTN